jgi:hypothetical protein
LTLSAGDHHHTAVDDVSTSALSIGDRGSAEADGRLLKLGGQMAEDRLDGPGPKAEGRE